VEVIRDVRDLLEEPVGVVGLRSRRPSGDVDGEIVLAGGTVDGDLSRPSLLNAPVEVLEKGQVRGEEPSTVAGVTCVTEPSRVMTLESRMTVRSPRSRGRADHAGAVSRRVPSQAA